MKSILRFSFLLIIMFSCKREKENYLGPAYISAPEGFSVRSFTATPSSVDFTLDTVKFNATFTHSVSWILTITGQTSGAVKELKGISSGFSNLTWTGTQTGILFFRAGETVTATLSFYGTTYTSSTTVNIIKPRDFTKYGTFPKDGDFEDPSKVVPPPYSPNWASFNYPTPIPNVVQGVDSVAVDYNGNIVPSVQGRKYYYIKGKGDQQVFVSGIQYFGFFTPKPPADPDKVWVNMYIYGTGDPNTSVDLEYQEADFDGSQPGYQGEDDDAFVAHLTLDHKGWKLFSFQYSKLVPSSNALFGGSGNKKFEPNRLKSFDLVLLKKTNPDSPVEVYFDFPIITVDGPFDPSK